MSDDINDPNDPNHSNDPNDKGGSDHGKDYDVGYKKPPRHSRFRKGQSGNPGGRKRGSRALKTDLDKALRATLTITVGGKKRSGTTQALAMYALAMRAATGDLRANKQLADLVMAVFGPEDRRGSESKLSKHDEELLERLLTRLEPEDGASDDATPDPESDDVGSETDNEIDEEHGNGS